MGCPVGFYISSAFGEGAVLFFLSFASRKLASFPSPCLLLSEEFACDLFALWRGESPNQILSHPHWAPPGPALLNHLPVGLVAVSLPGLAHVWGLTSLGTPFFF